MIYYICVNKNNIEMALTYIYILGFIVSSMWCIYYVNKFTPNRSIKLGDILFVILASIFSWLTVIVFVFRYLFGTDSDMLSIRYIKKHREHKNKTYHVKVDD